jgi:hypothetical protein
LQEDLGLANNSIRYAARSHYSAYNLKRILKEQITIADAKEYSFGMVEKPRAPVNLQGVVN